MEDQPTDASMAQTNGGIAPPASAASGGRGTSRRSLLKLIGAGAVGAAVGAGVTLVGGDALRPSTTTAVATTPLRFFNDADAATITAMAERIFPKDASGPGATDAHVATYIDGRLAGAWGLGAKTYRQGPYVTPADSGHGFQLAMTQRDIYKDALVAIDAYCANQYAKSSFDQLTAQQQDDTLHALESGRVNTFTTVPAATFFAMFRQNVVEGLFADPLYGGNFNLIGWRWIGFPGNPMAYGDPYAAYIDKFDTPYNVAPKPLG